MSVNQVSIPSRGFWFFEVVISIEYVQEDFHGGFQSPRGDFGFLKCRCPPCFYDCRSEVFQSPRGDFGFLKPSHIPEWEDGSVSGFNPLAGILVF